MFLADIVESQTISESPRNADIGMSCLRRESRGNLWQSLAWAEDCIVQPFGSNEEGFGWKCHACMVIQHAFEASLTLVSNRSPAGSDSLIQSAI
jgi:hypothetical protein